MKHFLFLTGFIITFSLTAQTTPNITGYFNEYWKAVSKDSATYYRTAEPDGDGYIVRDYYMSGQLQMDPVRCKAYSPKLIFDAVTTLYHPNGQPKEKGRFINEDRAGLHTYWYDNGTLHKVVKHEEKMTKVAHYYTPEGKPLLTNSTGVVPDEHIKNSFFEYQDSVMIASYVQDGDDLIYLSTKQPAEYEGGMYMLMKTIQSNLTYPSRARRAGVQGKVFIKFIVDENGISSRHEVIRGVDPYLDQEAIRVTRKLNSWKSAMHQGKKVKSAFVMPIMFKLE